MGGGPRRLRQNGAAMPRETFPFRPWVRSACRTAMLWGVGALAVLGLVTWLLRSPGEAPLGRAFGALTFYGALFLLTLAKIWWTAGRPAAVLEDDAIGYQTLHGFRLRRLPLERVLAAEPKAGTSSYRIVYRAGDVARELFLNLGVIDGRTRLLDGLGRRLGERGLEPVPGRLHAWRRPEWREDGDER